MEIAAGQPKKRTFKKFSFRGVDLDALLDMSTDELVKLFTARARRRFQRGLKRKPMALIKKLRKALLPYQSLMSMVKRHRIWLLEVTLMERSGKFLIWVEGLGIGILLFELFVLLTTQRELLNIYILSASLLVFDLFCEFIFQMGSAEA
ncbi:uncharacterized protein LOC114291626 [Camellia sinensis]|uniref:uncharacterized protein LOC114291626 n=1 Tax=Camellia sinensis TaxID=4442 RepID=UPI00103681BA|nr:uncharacterized protein LOC114291626 [Camellia sinensis]